MKLTDQQCNEFRRHPGSFNDMVQAIFDAGLAAREPIPDRLIHLFCNAVDNLGDMPVSEKWAERWVRDADQLLLENNYFRKPAPINSPACPTCNGAGVIGTPGASCPSCSLFALGKQFNAKPSANTEGAAQSQEPKDVEFTTLMRFYGVGDLAALVRAQEQHIQRLHILAFATPPKDAEVAMPQPCCGKYASCGRACVPRGRWEGQREGEVKECHVSALTQKIIQIRAGLTGLADPTERMDAMCATAADILLLLGDRT